MRKFGLSMLVFGMGMAACGPMIQLIDVDVKLPAEYPVHFENREIAIFNALYDITDQEGEDWNDHLLMNSVAEGFRDRLAADISIEADSIAVFNHFCGQTARGTLYDKEYIYSLSELSGAQTIVLIDSLKYSDIKRVSNRHLLTSDYSTVYYYTECQMVFRFFDMKSDQFLGRFSSKDTLYWSVLVRDHDSLVVRSHLLLSLPETAYYLGELAAKVTQPQWEMQERALFFFGGSSWSKALDHAFMFEWEDAQKIWLRMTQGTKNYKKIGYAAYNIAVASEMTGNIDLAKEWLDLAGKYVNIPEIKHYIKMLDERKQEQQRLFHVQIE